MSRSAALRMTLVVSGRTPPIGRTSYCEGSNACTTCRGTPRRAARSAAYSTAARPVSDPSTPTTTFRRTTGSCAVLSMTAPPGSRGRCAHVPSTLRRTTAPAVPQDAPAGDLRPLEDRTTATAPGTVGRPIVAEVARRVVLGVDGSAESRRAVSWAADTARRVGSPLLPVHAWGRPAPG